MTKRFPRSKYMVSSNFMLTIEGQLLFTLGPKLRDRVIIDDIEYQMPRSAVIQTFPGPLASKHGIRNSNVEPNQQNEICSFVQCAPTEDSCTNPVTPVGHCCSVCGVIMQFIDEDFDIYATSKKEAESMLLPSAGVSISRIDKSGITPKYEIAVFTDDPASFDENAYYRAAKRMFEHCADIAENNRDNSMFGGVKRHLSGFSETFSLETGKIRMRPLLEWLSLIAFIAGIVYLYLRNLYKTSPRFRMWLANRRRNMTEHAVVAWSNTKTGNNVEIVAKSETAEEGGQSELGYSPRAMSLEQSVYHQEFKNPIFGADDDIFASATASEMKIKKDEPL
uniref:Protein amnionless n=1 Tax=Panagrellus redivivus TaxID=6233 RepID=A0A7E4VIC1_PANRE